LLSLSTIPDPAKGQKPEACGADQTCDIARKIRDS
jgi:hypothetical protein